MLNTKYFSWLIVFILLYSTSSLANVNHQKILKVCYDQWPPMTIFPSKSQPNRGVVIDMVEHIYQSEGYQIEYFEVPLARGLAMVAEGICDMLPEYLFSPDLEKDFEFANQMTFAYATAFVVRRNDNWQYNGIQSIQGKRIATGPGWDYSSMSMDYQNYLDNPQNASSVEVIAGDSDVVERIFRMIAENRVDTYADNELVLQHVLNKLNLNHALKIVRPGLEKKLLEIPIFSKTLDPQKRQQLIKIWDEGRLSMRGSKEKRLLEKYQVSIK